MVRGSRSVPGLSISHALCYNGEKLRGRGVAMYQIAVCDDDRNDLRRATQLTQHAMEQAGIPCAIATYDSGALLLGAIQGDKKFDLLLLDVRMAEPDGMTLAAALKHQPARPDVVFISADRDMALQGYRVDAKRYLAKPLDLKELQEALLYCYHEAEGRTGNKTDLLLPTAGGEVRIPVREIRYAETWGRATRISLSSGYLETRLRLSELADLLPEQFIYCHRTTLVNLDYVRRMSQGELELLGGGTLLVSRYRVAEIRRKLLDTLNR